MSSTRRSFLQQASAFSLLAGRGSLLAQHTMSQMALPASPVAQAQPPMLRAATLTPFVDPLPLPKRIMPGQKTARIAMREGHVQVHRDLPPTRIWCYAEASASDVGHVAPLIEARSGKPLRVEWINQLPEKHFLPVDFSLHGCGRELPEVRTIAHLHGAKVPSSEDGYPTDWFTVGHSRVCTYPLQQEATALWYHDHAMGLNRLNTYAGMFGSVFVRDEAEDALELPAGEHELPLTFVDRYLTKEGQLFYPTSGDPEHPWVPEFYGDAILVNGVMTPYVEVEPRMYRLRILNAANSRFFSLGLSNHQPIHVIGGDQGLLAQTVMAKSVLLSPGERLDLLVDFSQVAGQHVQLVNGILEMMQFRVATSKQAMPAAVVPTKLRDVPKVDESAAILTRSITLNEIQDKIQNPMMMLLNHKHWHEPVTEKPKLGSTEIWEFVNLTEDTHPMHLHLVRFRVLDRRVFEPFDYQTHHQFKFLAAAMPPEPWEGGWKDVVQCPPGTVTRIMVMFDGFAGKYLYHCHVLEHEANDMMRPFEVVA